MSSAGSVENTEPEELTLSEIAKKYNARYVAIVVTERDKNFQPIKGRVVENDVDRYMLRAKTGKYNDICIFYAGESPFRLLL